MFTLVHIIVDDFNAWKSSFDSMDDFRTNGGVVSTKVFQIESSPNEAVILLEWSDSEKAKEYFASPDLKEAMQKGGVQGTPHIKFLKEV